MQLFDTDYQRTELGPSLLELWPQVDFGDSKRLLNELIENTLWSQRKISLFGKTLDQPRLVAWYGDPNARYTYSKLSFEPLAWTKLLLSIKQTTEMLTGQRFNSVLLNYYRDNQDSMGLHADNEPELGAEPYIASVSFGATRFIHFAPASPEAKAQFSSFKLELTDSSVLAMSGQTQTHFKHEVKKQRSTLGPRVNLTFRWVYE